MSLSQRQRAEPACATHHLKLVTGIFGWHRLMNAAAMAAATHSEVDVPVREAGAAPATPAPRPPAQLVMGGPLPRQPARAPSNPELVVGTDPEMEHPPAVTPDATN